MSVQINKKSYAFQAEVKQLLKLMIHSLYSNKEIFLRELISNASDAADKLKFEALGNSDLFEQDSALKIRINFDKDKKIISVQDNGIGMDQKEIMNNIGTIAKSGTKEFLSRMTGDRTKDSQLIGQFGVGFYSCFIVAKEVEIYSRRAGKNPEQGVYWSSQGEGNYELQQITKKDRGTEVILHLKDEEEEFLNSWKLRQIITKYADHISIPVMMKKEPEPQAKIDDKNKSGIINVIEEEIVNRASALWTLPKKNITNDQYKELYKHIAHDFEDPLAWIHNKVEGKLEYTSLLYIPKRAPLDIWMGSKPKGLKLYVQRIFIMDEVELFLPNYLRFIRGVIDSNVLPLNVSREILQNNRMVNTIRSALIKRVLDMLEKMVIDKPEDYKVFWKEFGQIIKEGPAEESANKTRIAKLLRFTSTHQKDSEQNVCLDDYVSRMPKNQKKIYYITAETYQAAKNSPHLEIFRKKGIEVLLLSDRVDEWLMAHLTEVDDKKFQSIAKGKLELEDIGDKQDAAKQEKLSKTYKDMLDKMKEILKDEVKHVCLSDRLTDSPSCVIRDEHEMSAYMERIMQTAGKQISASKPILELNPEHTLIKKLKAQINKLQAFSDLTWLLFDQAMLTEGGQLKNPARFVRCFNAMLS